MAKGNFKTKGKARQEWLTLNELLVAVGANVYLYKSIEQAWGDMAKHIPAFHGLSLGKIPENGVQIRS